MSPLSRLFADSRRFGFDAAVRVLLRARRQNDPGEVARFRTPPGLAFPSADIPAITAGIQDDTPPRVTVSMIGLTGAMGVLPRFYSETLATTLRDRSYALHDFLDLLGHRFIALFARAGIKYRLPRAAETAREVQPRETHEGGQAVDSISLGILALTGFATPHLTDRLAVGIEPLLHYAGFFAARPRSAERLGAMVADWLGHPVEVVQFAGGWLPLPREERSRLPVGRQPGAWNQLGKDAAIGVRSWDVQARIVLRVGPLNRAAFEALLPDQPGLARLVSLARAFLGYETGFAINPVLIREDIPALILQPGAPSAPRLGWNTWVPGTEKARQNGVEPMFEAELVELSNNAIGQ